MNLRISENWLRLHGFQRVTQEKPFHWRLAVAAMKPGGRGFMESPDDVCIEVSLTQNVDPMNVLWHCWIVQVEPCRHIHVRRIEFVHEIQMLFLGLTGIEIPGSCQCPFMALKIDAIEKGLDPNEVLEKANDAETAYHPGCAWHGRFAR